MTDAPTVREATPPELAAVLNVLDGAALETDAEVVDAAIERGDVLVAVSAAGRHAGGGNGRHAGGGDGQHTSGGAGDASANGGTGTVVGALVLDAREIASVAVRPRRRGLGIGTALVDAAAARRHSLVAEFDADVRPFYESLGFAVEPLDEGDRYRGRYDPDSG